MTFQRPILWIHEEALGANNPALQAWPEAPAVFVFDTRWIEKARISRKRLGFLYEKALDLPLTLRKGDVAAEVLASARRCSTCTPKGDPTICRPFSITMREYAPETMADHSTE